MTKADFFATSPISRTLSRRSVRGGGCVIAVALAVGLSAGGPSAEEAALARDDWKIQVEFAPPSDGEADPWQAHTVLLDMPRVVTAPVASGDHARVAWLDGFQRQASHLGMALGMGRETVVAAGDGAAPDQASVFAFGLTRFVKTIAVRSASARATVGSQLAWTASETVEDFAALGATRGAPGGATRAEADAGGFVTAVFTGTPTGAPAAAAGALSGAARETVSVLPGGERRREVSASLDPCPNKDCFGRDLIGWRTSLAACTKDVRIGVIDTSFDISHPAFKKLKVVRKEFIEGVKPSQDDWHGTAILSLLAGDPDSGTPGLVPDATFLLATAFRSDADGNASTDTERLLEALEWLDQLGVDVVNMSFSGPPHPAIARAIERMSLKGVMFAAAAGNMGPTAPASYPAAYPHVIAVTAVNRNGENYRNANRGAYIDIAAPGVDILTALPDGKQGYRTGTSFAVPFVTAILATRAASGMIEGTEQLLLDRIAVKDLGVRGRDPVYGIGLARAPTQCPGGALVARASDKRAKGKPRRAGALDVKW